MPARSRVPLWLKIAWTLWMAAWVPFYWHHYGPQNFLWFCDTANFLILIALWTESSLLISWPAVSVLLVQLVWTVDLTGRFLIGSRFLGTVEYMWDPTIPRVTRLLSLFHAAVPFILLWGVRRLGYDRRAFLCQTLWCWLLLPICFFGWGGQPGFEGGINWVVGPFDTPQKVMNKYLYLVVCMVGYPILLYAPSHFALKRLFERREPAVSGS